ncbi:hypothetical protein K2Y00_00555 [Patescibacteria group bacterium]|nr:hypothetical protein [Patescibacteria group bacterium]
MTERKLSAFHQQIKDNLDNRKSREKTKGHLSRTGLVDAVTAITGQRHIGVIDAVLATSQGAPLSHTGKKTLYYPPEVLRNILQEILKERISPKERQNIEIHLSK